MEFRRFRSVALFVACSGLFVGCHSITMPRTSKIPEAYGCVLGPGGEPIAGALVERSRGVEKVAFWASGGGNVLWQFTFTDSAGCFAFPKKRVFYSGPVGPLCSTELDRNDSFRVYAGPDHVPSRNGDGDEGSAKAGRRIVIHLTARDFPHSVVPIDREQIRTSYYRGLIRHIGSLLERRRVSKGDDGYGRLMDLRDEARERLAEVSTGNIPTSSSE